MKPREAPGQALCRVCRRHAEKALDNLKKPDLAEAVHEVRKEIKKLRALFRLAQKGLGGKTYKQTAETMRLASKPLAESRDARVVQRAFADLAGRRAADFPDIRFHLDKLSSRAERNFKDFDFASVVQHILREVCRQLDEAGLEAIRWPDIRGCLEKTYARGHEAYHAAMLEPAAEHFHEWRKRVKELHYQLDFLGDGWPPRTQALLDGLEKLGNIIGDDHDLVLLKNFLTEQCEPNRETSGLQELIDAKRHEYAAGIRQLGSRFYAQPPEVICVQVEEDWKKTRKG